MIRRLRVLCVLCLWLVLVVTSAHAAIRRCSITVVADGTNLGTASCVLDVTSKQDGHVTWKLSEGQFAPATLSDGKVVWDDSILSGTGDTVPSSGAVTIKDFTATVQKNSGVDVTYRFRLSATLENGEVKDAAITQQP